MQLRRERRPGLAGTGDSETGSVPWASLHPHRQPPDLLSQPAGWLLPPWVCLLQGGRWIAGYKANVRSTDSRVLGIVSDRSVDELAKIKLSDQKILDLMQTFFPVSEEMSDTQKKNNLRLLEDLKQRYWNAPDLADMGKNGYRFINAVSDFATHADPIRKTKSYNENLFLRTIEGNPLIDKAYKMVRAAA